MVLMFLIPGKKVLNIDILMCVFYYTAIAVDASQSSPRNVKCQFFGHSLQATGVCSSGWCFIKFVVRNPCQSSPSLTILVSLWFIIFTLVFFYLSELPF